MSFVIFPIVQNTFPREWDKRYLHKKSLDKKILEKNCCRQLWMKVPQSKFWSTEEIMGKKSSSEKTKFSTWCEKFFRVGKIGKLEKKYGKKSSSEEIMGKKAPRRKQSFELGVKRDNFS